MLKKTIKTLFVASLFSTAAVAAPETGSSSESDYNSGQPTSVNEWIKGASKAVDDVMKYPRLALRYGETGSGVYRVTIDKSGTVKGFETLEAAAHYSLQNAAKKVIRKADFPQIPASFGGDEMTFQVVLNYLSPEQFRRMERKLESGSSYIEEYASNMRAQPAQFKVLPARTTN